MAADHHEPAFLRFTAKGVLAAILTLGPWPPAAPGPQGETESRVLEPGTAIERDLADQQIHNYEISLTAGEHARLTVTESGIAVVLRVAGPEDLPPVEIRGRTTGPQLSLVAEKSGVYRLEIRARRPKSPPGRYELRAGERHAATTEDRHRSAGEIGIAQGVQRCMQGTPESISAGMRSLEGAQGHWRALGDASGEALSLHLLGACSVALRDPAKVLHYSQQALALRQALRDPRGEADALGNMAIAYTEQGEFEKALQSYRQAIDRFRSVGDRGEEGRALHNMGVLYKRLGELSQASEIFKQALSLRRAAGDRRSEALTLNNLGRVELALEEPQKAQEHLEQALGIYRELGDRHGEVEPLHGLALVSLERGETEKAREQLAQTLALAREVWDRDVEAEVLGNLGRMLGEKGESEEALQHFGQALTIYRTLGETAGEAAMLAEIARLHRDTGRLEEAREGMDLALARLESLRARVPSHHLRATFVAAKHDAYSLQIDILLGLHARDPSKGYDIAAFELSERARARGLLETLAEARAQVREGVDAVLLERERALQQRLNAKEQQRAELLRRKTPEAEAEKIREELEGLLIEYQQLQAEIRTGSPRYAGLTQPQPLSLREIQEQVLDGESLLLEYALGEERSAVFSVTPRELRCHVLPPRKEIETAARTLYMLLSSRERRMAQVQTDVAAAELARILLGPVSAELGDRRLLIVGDGILQFIPFGMLPEPETRGSAAPLILRHEIVSLPSASVVSELRRERPGRVTALRQVAVVSDPVFSAADPRVRSAGTKAEPPSSLASDLTRAATESGILDLRRLRFSRQEARAIAALVPQEDRLLALDFAASRATVVSPEIAQYRIVHVATHGLLNSRHPELSGIVLSLVDEEGRPQDGFLRAHEVYNLKLNADLVVLSACQTALGKQVKGEGLLGLTRGFMYAGAPRVVASVWDVRDDATSELMKRFYRRMLKKGLRPAAALREAQVSCWKESRWRAPQNWAGFILQGEWR